MIFLRHEADPVTPLTLARTDLAATLDEAYRALAARQRATPARWGGWKLGGTNHASRSAFGVRCGYYGALDQAEIRGPLPEGVPEGAPEGPLQVPDRPLAELKGEVELALRLDAALSGFDAWAVALEMPSSAVRNLADLGVIALVSDRCAAGALVLGAARPLPLPDLSQARFAQRINGAVAGAADLSALVDRPGALLAEFLDLARAHDAPLRAGQWVATGGITPCLPYAPGDRVEILVDDRVVLDLVIATG